MIILNSDINVGLLSKSGPQQDAVIKHELGHILALAHPDNEPTTVCIMQSGFDYPASLAIQSHDRQNLIAKWD